MKNPGKLKLSAIFAAALALVYALTGFLLVPYIANSKLAEVVHAKFGATATVQKIHFNPFTFEVEISDLVIAEPDISGEKVSLGHLYLNLQIFPLFKNEIKLSSFYLGNTKSNFTIYSEGKTNWTPKTDAELAEAKTAQPSKWILTIEEIKIENTSLKFTDKTHREELQLPLGPINLTAHNISTGLSATSDLKMLKIVFGDGGFLIISGKASLQPVSADINFETSKVPLDFISAYLSDKTYLKLQSGFYDGKGSVQYNDGVVRFNSDSKISNFNLVHKTTMASAAKWEAMSIRNLQVQSSPLKVRMDEVIFDRLSTGVVLKKDGHLNYKDYFREVQTQAAASSTTASKVSGARAPSAPDLLISKLTFLNGKLLYADEQIKPKFSANISELNGFISPITLELNKKINVNLSGRVETAGKFKASGYHIMTAKRPSLDLSVSFKNIELTTFTPYAGKFAGYEISKGKLFLDINYNLKDNLIRGKNNAVLDQFTLGNKIESETATNLPVKLALALLKDREGKIKINLPVEGDVDSPQFQMSELIWTAIKNVIINIATAPFDFLKGMMGGDDNMDSIIFVAGSDVLAPNQELKIQNLAKFLAERPNLTLEIQGRYQISDIEALKKSMRQTEVPPEQLKAMALSRSQKIQLALADAQVEAERIFVIAAAPDEDSAIGPRAALLLKSKD